ncbi:hypothetical protein [Caldicellulosiruptor naganoensis]|uniref:Uncharacterized protein n=1 Tax=Caldicellulosiruptor naganoensis TaxID=29324 RepID=A0ABY7BFG3_9FIRM|nr:hypothetical protein [Caldicellulosiruptor naganoensis]WAM30836.1 hypothetical protein OTJ99_001620 [Caldicellulosiruptor naganoensis]
MEANFNFSNDIIYRLEQLKKSNNKKFSKLIEFLKIYFEMIYFVQKTPMVSEEEKKLFREWFEEKGKDYLLSLIDLVETYGAFLPNFEAVVDYYIFYLKDAYENNDIVEIIDWLYGILKSLNDRLLERFDFNLKSEVNFISYEGFVEISDHKIVKTCGTDAGFYLYCNYNLWE